MTVPQFFAAIFFCLCSLLGGVTSDALKPHALFDSRHAGPVEFSDAAGHKRYAFGPGPFQQLIGREGAPRLALGLETTAQGQPFIRLGNNRGELRMVWRLAGPGGSPVIAMKDRQGRDRIVLGLGPAETGEEPYLALYDTHGGQQMVFGEAAPKGDE